MPKETFHLVIDSRNTKICSGKPDLRKTKSSSGNSWYWVGIAGDFGFVIAIPIVLGAVTGTFLDRQWQTYPKATLAGLTGGVILSVIGFIHQIAEFMRKS